MICPLDYAADEARRRNFAPLYSFYAIGKKKPAQTMQPAAFVGNEPGANARQT